VFFQQNVNNGRLAGKGQTGGKRTDWREKNELEGKEQTGGKRTDGREKNGREGKNGLEGKGQLVNGALVTEFFLNAASRKSAE